MMDRTGSSHRWIAAVTLLAVCLMFARSVRAQVGSVLTDMPRAQVVLDSISGDDDLDTAAKRAGAMYQLSDIVGAMAGGRLYRNQLTAEESRLRGDYLERYTKISSRVLQGFDPKETRRLGWASPNAKWLGARTRYETSKVFRAELVDGFFSQRLKDHYFSTAVKEGRASEVALEKGVGKMRSVAASSGESSLSLGGLFIGGIVGIVALVIGIKVILYAIASYNELNRRREGVRKWRSNIQVAIERRCTAVNDLAQVAQHYATGEQFTHLQVSRDTSVSGLANAYQESGALLHNVQHAAERFPHLKSNEQYNRLCDLVAGCENDIQANRQWANEAVEYYNTIRQQFPRVFFANLMGLAREEYIELDVSQARQVARPLALQQDNSMRLNHMLGMPAAPAPAVAGHALPGGAVAALPPASQLHPAQVHAPQHAPQSAVQLGSRARGGGTEAVQALPSFLLRFDTGPLEGRTLPIGAGLVIGREAGAAQLVVPHPQVSMAHAWIGMQGGSLVFVDRGSTNGSLVNGVRVTPEMPIPVNNGDRVTLGQTHAVSFVVAAG